jgi:hypothetical protein
MYIGHDKRKSFTFFCQKKNKERRKKWEKENVKYLCNKRAISKSLRVAFPFSCYSPAMRTYIHLYIRFCVTFYLILCSFYYVYSHSSGKINFLSEIKKVSYSFVLKLFAHTHTSVLLLFFFISHKLS